MTKASDVLHDIADELQGDAFFNRVARKVAEQRGVPLTEQMRREIVAHLRASTEVRIGPEPEKPN